INQLAEYTYTMMQLQLQLHYSLVLIFLGMLYYYIVMCKEWSLTQGKEIQQSRWRRSPRNPNLPRMSQRNRKKTKNSRDCHLEKKEMRVKDLGLGYDSDEIVLFKYCVGTCHSSRKNYDLALKALMANGSISGKNVSSHPCCRPIRYETVSFMDTQTTWQTIKWLSAANCSCVG
uniref:Artemin a n=1 Tax=Dicentrarchus labrax TaxID=13489 RepID=A0A8C4NKP1_DICLA